MSQLTNVVSVHPYFKIKPGKLESFKIALSGFIEHATQESGNLFYDFTICGDVVFCREAYAGAEGFLEHLRGVGPLMGISYSALWVGITVCARAVSGARSAACSLPVVTSM